MTAESIAPAIVRRFVQSSSLAPAEVGFEMLRAIPKGAWTPDMVLQIQQTLSGGELSPAPVLPDGTPLSSAIRELLADIAPPAVASTSTPADDDIPF